MERGYVKLWRRSFESVVFADERLWKLWCLCLMLAAHKNKTMLMADTYVGIKLLPGQFLTGRYALHKLYYPKPPKDGEIQVHPRTIWRWLQALERMEKLSIETHSKGSVITVNNWSHYQVTEQSVSTSPAQASAGLQSDSGSSMSSSCPTAVHQLSTSKSHADKGFPEGHLPENRPPVSTNKKKEVNTTTTTKKNIKKKSVKKIDLCKMEMKDVDLSEIDEKIKYKTIEQFIIHRAAKKSPLTQNALELTCKTAMKCAEAYDMDPNDAIFHGIEKGWQSISVKWLERDFSKKEVAIRGNTVQKQFTAVVPYKAQKMNDLVGFIKEVERQDREVADGKDEEGIIDV